MALEFVPENNGKRNCDGPVVGTPHPDFDYLTRSITGDDVYSKDACPRFLQVNGKFDNLQVTLDVDASTVTATTVTATEVTASGITLTSRKSFDIPHPVKSGYRLRHVCLEGPESAVYYRGRLSNSNIINLPDYWVGLVDPESITVTLTQINSSQDLIVEKIDSEKTIKIRSGSSSTIDCYFLVYGERIDGEKLIVEYEGNQYPGDDSQYSLNK
jgi:hypothetical protein